MSIEVTATRAATATAPPTAPDRLRRLALVVRHLVPSRHDPERFHLTKSEVEKALRRIAAELERGSR